MSNEQKEERRKNSGLTQEQIEAIAQEVLATVYADIGRSLVRKIIWAVGSVLVALSAWLAANHVSVK